MRATLLIVAVLALIAGVSAQTISTYGTLKGTYYTNSDCATGTSTALTFTGSSTVITPCATIGTGSTAQVATGNCYSYSYSGITASYWNFQLYNAGSTCVVATGVVTGNLIASGFDVSASTNIFPDTAAKGVLYPSSSGCFSATSCSNGASSLVVPSFLLVALAFAARKLSL